MSLIRKTLISLWTVKFAKAAPRSPAFISARCRTIRSTKKAGLFSAGKPVWNVAPAALYAKPGLFPGIIPEVDSASVIVMVKAIKEIKVAKV